MFPILYGSFVKFIAFDFFENLNWADFSGRTIVIYIKETRD